MDEEQNPTQTQEVEETSAESTETQEPTNEEQVVDTQNEPSSDDESNDEELDEGNEESDAELSPRQQKRVEQIENEAKEYKLNKILDRIQTSQTQPRTKSGFNPMDYREAMDAPDEVYEKLENDRRASAEASYNEGLRTAEAIEWRTNIKIDLPIVKEVLDRLDPEDAAAIDREYLLYSQYDPETGYVANSGISYADFVTARVEQVERIAKNLQVKSQKNIAKQAAQTGIRPDGGSNKPKFDSPDDIAKLTPEQYRKHKTAIDAKINSILGIK